MLELIESLNSFQHRSPKLYLGLVIACAAIGISLLLLLPILSVNFFIAGIVTVFSIENAIDLTSLLYQLPISALFAYLSYQFVTLSLDTPKTSEIYISINKKKTPKLIALIHEMEQHFNINSIDTIILTDQYDISIHITPFYCLPQQGWTSLQIGLPLMQTISANEFKGLLARRIGQLSLKNNKTTGWINFYRDILNQYLVACQQSTLWSLKPFFYYIRSYQRIFNAVSFYAIRMDELQADQYAIDVVDEKVFSEALSQTILASDYLKNIFWMSMYKLQRQYPNKTIFPHANMSVSFMQSFNIEKSRALIKQDFQKLYDFTSPAPLLRTRLLEIGFESFDSPKPLEATAAKIYLDKALPKVTRIFDKLWIQRLHSHSESATFIDSTEQRLNMLSSKITEQPLSAAETWELAVLTEKIKGYHAAIPIYKKILERNPMHAKSMFALGRILLSYNDPTGLDALDKAIFLEPNMKKTADELIIRYQTRLETIPEKPTKLTA